MINTTNKIFSFLFYLFLLIFIFSIYINVAKWCPPTIDWLIILFYISVSLSLITLITVCNEYCCCVVWCFTPPGEPAFISSTHIQNGFFTFPVIALPVCVSCVFSMIEQQPLLLLGKMRTPRYLGCCFVNFDIDLTLIVSENGGDHKFKSRLCCHLGKSG